MEFRRRKNTILILSLILFFMIVCSCQWGKEDQGKDRVVAKVEGKVITQRDLIRYYDTLVHPVRPANGQRETLPLSFKKALLEKLIEESLLLRIATKEGIQVTPKEVDNLYHAIERDYGKNFRVYLKRLGVKPDEWKADLHRDLIIEKVLEHHLKEVEGPTRKEIQSYYDSHRKEFQIPMQFRFSQIVVPTLKVAKQIEEKLRNGAKFAKLARQYSISPEGKQGGDLGYWREDRLPEEFLIVRQMKLGEISGIIHSPYGYHILNLTGVREARQLSLKEAAPRIVRKLIQERREKEKTRWIRELKKKASIVLYERVLKGTIFN